MPTVTYHHPDADPDVVEAEDGTSVMRTAVGHGVPGIVGECGGQAMCATCHVYVREEYLDGLPEISDDEDEMLDCTTAPRDDERSRLSCQLKCGTHFDRLEVDVPPSQV
ncbi:2Fe-2S iron-sulfur cluster-binding protein [Georgenia sp. H159]|uniref:2Fe-2S iron-sulfur cluster-binding protein n=1 Tax=Georgenia sp. H159 TaxID=3076115 RepID=UPI002D7A041B|nr:2Fe-2S iron-sulfur cluster-binding protein [Georgenia sp. H159]